MSANCPHYWDRNPTPRDSTEAWVCTSCPATSAQCVQGEHPAGSAIPLCIPCQRRIEQHLDQLADYLGLALAYEESRSPVRSPMDYRLMVKGSKMQHESDGAEGIVEILYGWTAAWTEAGAGDAAEGALPFLRSRLVWAATNPGASGWVDFISEVGSMRIAAREIAGLGPRRLPERCVYCNDHTLPEAQRLRGDLVQDRCDAKGRPYPDGLQVEIRCVTCDRRWEDRQHYQLVVRQRLAEADQEKPNATATIEQAKRLWPEVPPATWRRWRQRKELEPNKDGLYLLADLRRLVTRRTADARPGRPASMVGTGQA